MGGAKNRRAPCVGRATCKARSPRADADRSISPPLMQRPQAAGAPKDSVPSCFGVSASFIQRIRCGEKRHLPPPGIRPYRKRRLPEQPSVWSGISQRGKPPTEADRIEGKRQHAWRSSRWLPQPWLCNTPDGCFALLRFGRLAKALAAVKTLAPAAL